MKGAALNSGRCPKRPMGSVTGAVAAYVLGARMPETPTRPDAEIERLKKWVNETEKALRDGGWAAGDCAPTPDTEDVAIVVDALEQAEASLSSLRAALRKADECFDWIRDSRAWSEGRLSDEMKAKVVVAYAFVAKALLESEAPQEDRAAPTKGQSE